ncbi:TraB/GumN family protein [Maricaulaceae bacterium EIL42A08]|nr:TraB/GumN family protein [Maricaulaceae bacterium EIL42A08]
MLKKLLKGAAAFVAGVGCGTVLASVAVAQTDYAAIDANPGVWSISDEDSTVYIFGTVHILPPELDWQSETVLAALNDAETVYFEADVLSPEAQAATQALIPQLGLNPPGVTLTSMISDEARGHMAIIAGRLGAPADALAAQMDPLQPWLASLTLAVLQIQMGGYDPASGVEAQLNGLAQGAGKEFGYFEDVEQQLRFFADVPMELQVTDFEVGVRQMVEEPDVLSNMVQAWAAGDLEQLDTLFNDAMSNSSPELFQRIIVDRNIDWIPQIEAALAGSDDALVAVGAGHLPGPQGVLALLEAEGHTVTRQ